MGGIEIFANGVFQLNPEEIALVKHLRSADSTRARRPKTACSPPRSIFRARALRRTRDRCRQRRGIATVLAHLTHEYVSENADYRS